MAALLALVQIAAQRSGSVSPIATFGMSVMSFAQGATTNVVNAVRNTATTTLALPQLERENAALRTANQRLREQNANLHASVAADAMRVRIAPIVDLYHGIPARVIGFPPENQERVVTIDRGSHSGIKVHDGVVAPGGVVGRIESVGPFFSKVRLLTDYTSRIPAVIRHGHWWGIAHGDLSSIHMEYIPQDAPLKIGDVVVTGAGRSFHAGLPIGRITQIERNVAMLYQTAVVKPAVDPGSLDRVVVLPQ